MRGNRTRWCSWLRASALLGVLAGCGTGTTDPNASVSGLWSYSDHTSGASGTVRCSLVGILDLDQSGGSVTGRISGRGGCETPSVALDFVVGEAITLGRIAQGLIAFDAAGCRYQGTVTTSRGAGTLACDGGHTGAVPVAGTWEMTLQ